MCRLVLADLPLYCRPMAIYGQPNAWTCGPFALKHGLLALGVFAREDELARAAGSTETLGTDETGLRRAARLHGTELRLVRDTRPEGVRAILARWLARRVPVLLCIDQWEHWITAVAADDAHVVVFDSKYDTPLRREPWEALLERLACRRAWLGGVWTRTLYDVHPVVPRHVPRLRLALTPERARALEQSENAALAGRWDDYARALVPLALSPRGQGELGLELERYLTTRRSAILDRAVSHLGVPETAAAVRVLDSLAFVAGMYGALLAPELEAVAEGRFADLVVELVQGQPDGPRAANSASAA